MKCQVCRPGMMLCSACMAEEEEPPTVRNPRKEDSWNLPLVRSNRAYRPVASNPPKLRRSPSFIPIYEVIEPYDCPVAQ